MLTSDNPRSEDPLAILAAIEADRREGDRDPSPTAASGVLRTAASTPSSRIEAAAIRLAVGASGVEDTVLICGKGHETYQIVGDTVRHFDDREEARQALSPPS